MTDPIAEGVKLVPGLQEDVDEMKRSPLWPQSVPLHRNTLEAVIRALTAAGEMERELAEAREAALEEAAKAVEDRLRLRSCTCCNPAMEAIRALAASPSASTGKDVPK